VIFVTVGNATQGFRRLISAVDALAGDGLWVGEPVFIQTGHTADVKLQHCEYKPFLSMDEFQRWMEKADLIICHGGCTQLQAIRLGRVPVVMPRRKKYGEHVNDHQLQLVEVLATDGRIVPAYEPEDLPHAIIEARKRNAQRTPPPSSLMLTLVGEAIEQFLGQR
jgi:UDP-N-acetylglucosamine transferase subunit ALG13